MDIPLLRVEVYVSQSPPRAARLPIGSWVQHATTRELEIALASLEATAQCLRDLIAPPT